MYCAELKKIVEVFHLENILPEINLEKRCITRREVNRPALQLAGFYERFDNDRLQIIGRVEHSFLDSLTPEKRREAICYLFEYHIPCLIVCKNFPGDDRVRQEIRRSNISHDADNNGFCGGNHILAAEGTGGQGDDARRTGGYLR